MIVAKVVGRVWADRRIAGFDGTRLLSCRPLDGGDLCVAVDLIDAAVGATVLVTTDEAAREALGRVPGDAAIVALVGGMDEVP